MNYILLANCYLLFKNTRRKKNILLLNHISPFLNQYNSIKSQNTLRKSFILHFYCLVIAVQNMYRLGVDIVHSTINDIFTRGTLRPNSRTRKVLSGHLKQCKGG